MRVSSLLLLVCMILASGSYHGLSEAASIVQETTSLANLKNYGDNEGILSFLNILHCSNEDKQPTPEEVISNPTKGLNALICYIAHQLMNASGGMIEKAIPMVTELLKNAHDRGFIPPPFDGWVQTILLLYEMSNVLFSKG